MVFPEAKVTIFMFLTRKETEVRILGGSLRKLVSDAIIIKGQTDNANNLVKKGLMVLWLCRRML